MNDLAADARRVLNESFGEETATAQLAPESSEPTSQ
jgi:hypothetical protein